MYLIIINVKHTLKQQADNKSEYVYQIIESR